MQGSFDVCILGSGFAGSLLAWILARRGLRVAIIDRSHHPRFAIGESSTPLADFLLEQLAGEHGLEPLRTLSRWGSWQRSLPQLRAGKKRGFSYFAHSPNASFSESIEHEKSWLVAASSDDERSDTHWMRSDVDHWLCRQAQSAGAELFEDCAIAELGPADLGPAASGQTWRLELQANSEHSSDEQRFCPQQLLARFLVDASGGGGVLGQALGLRDLREQLLVRSGALFGHFCHVQSMRDWQVETRLPIDDDPFHPDDAAQHHLLEDDWCWMLRFNEGTTSVGLVGNSLGDDALSDPSQRWHAWQARLQRFPTLGHLMNRAQLVAPEMPGPEPGQLGWIPRISRLWSEAAGVNRQGLPWAMLPGTVGIVDPLHSTGIAHGLWGVRQLARLITNDWGSDWLAPHQRRRLADQRRRLAAYSQSTVAEVMWIDRIVAAAYAAMHHFPLFQAACGLYFVSAIHCERHLASHYELPQGWLLKDHPRLQQIVGEFLARSQGMAGQSRSLGESQASADRSRDELVGWLRLQLAEWDDVGLLDPQFRNRVARSVAPKSV